MLNFYLSSLNYEVFTYADPVICPIYEQNGDVCPQTAPCADAMITDYRMPRMNGVELIEAQERKGCKLSLINKAVMSGYIDHEAVGRIKQMGCAFFEKPVDLRALTDWLKSCESRVDQRLPLGNRRYEERIPFTHLIRFSIDPFPDEMNGIAVNISDSGFCLRLSSTVETWQTIRIGTPLPNDCAAAAVRWVQPRQDGSYLAGFQCRR